MFPNFIEGDMNIDRKVDNNVTMTDAQIYDNGLKGPRIKVHSKLTVHTLMMFRVQILVHPWLTD